MKSLMMIALLSGTGLAGQTAWAQSSGGAVTMGIQDIVVTAQKREERLQDVPIAVSAISNDQIREQRIQDVIDLGTIVPSLIARPSPSGDQGIFTLRGSLAASGPNPTVDASVSQYIDGVYLGAQAGSLNDISDVERVEVIRGPAGTLFGTNATGGAINYITSRPKGEFYARQDLSYSRFDSFRSKTRLDLPEWNGFSVSLSYLHNYRGNNVRNLNDFTVDTNTISLGQKDRITSARKLGWSMTDAVHAGVRFKPLDDLVIDYAFDYARRNDPGPASQLIGFVDGGGGLFAQSFINASAALGGPSLADYIQTERSTGVYNGLSSVAKNKATSHFVSLEYNANDYLTIKNIASWRQIDREFRLNQLDSTGGLRTATGDLFTILAFGGGEIRNQFSNETQFIINTEKIDLTAGLFYYTRHTRPGTYTTRIFSFSAFPQSTEPSVDFVAPGSFLPGQANTFFRTRQIAGYAQGTYHLTPQIDITGGIRYAQDSKLIFDGTGTGTSFDYNKGTFTYLASASYKPVEDVMVYAKYATGFVAGGLTFSTLVLRDPAGGATFGASVSAPYEPETAKSAELGVKADFFDHRLRTNIAVFSVDYANLQAPTQQPVTVVAPSGQTVGASFSGIDNIGKARARGIEYEVTATPLPGLTLTANGAYNSFKYIDAPAGQGAPTLRPKFTTNLGAEYTVPVSGDMRMSLRGDANYRSKQIIVSGFPFSENPAVNSSGAALNELVEAKGQWTLSARATLRDVPLGPTKAQISVWGRNLTNNQQLVAAANLGTVVSGLFEDPTTYGVDLTVEF